jgi:glycosyltransferase involved in cell wall biosynthesis
MDRPAVLILTTDMAVKGGTQGVVAQLARVWTKHLRVTLAFLDGGFCVHPMEGTRIVALGPRGTSRRLRAAMLPLHILKLKRLIDSEKPDAVVSFLARANLVNIACRPLARHRYRCIASERNFNSIQYRGGLSAYILRQAMKLMYPRADAIVVGADSLAKDLQKSFRIPASNIVVIPNPVDAAGLRARNQHLPGDLEADGSFFLSVGRLVRQKSPELLLRAFSRVRRLKQCRLVVLGDGPLRADAERLALALGVSDDVSFLGWRDDAAAFMSRAAALVLTSDFEGFPNVVVEAMACGCPVIATDSPGGTAEILGEGRYGQLVLPGDAEGLVAAMLRALDDPSLSAVAAKAMTRVREFDSAVIGRRFLDLLCG